MSANNRSAKNKKVALLALRIPLLILVALLAMLAIGILVYNAA